MHILNQLRTLCDAYDPNADRETLYRFHKPNDEILTLLQRLGNATEQASKQRHLRTSAVKNFKETIEKDELPSISVYLCLLNGSEMFLADGRTRVEACLQTNYNGVMNIYVTKFKDERLMNRYISQFDRKDSGRTLKEMTVFVFGDIEDCSFQSKILFLFYSAIQYLGVGLNKNIEAIDLKPGFGDSLTIYDRVWDTHDKYIDILARVECILSSFSKCRLGNVMKILKSGVNCAMVHTLMAYPNAYDVWLDFFNHIKEERRPEGTMSLLYDTLMSKYVNNETVINQNGTMVKKDYSLSVYCIVQTVSQINFGRFDESELYWVDGNKGLRTEFTKNKIMGKL